MAALGQDFKAVCREWRRFRKLSQLDLAMAANVSQRHVSWLETGKSQPSRAMVVRLSEAMDIPLRERNVLLQAAGFSSAFAESSLTAPAMAPVLDVLETMLVHHEPLPAFVIDRGWNVKLNNRAAEKILQLGVDQQLVQLSQEGGELNLAELTLHPQGLRRFTSNWSQIAPAFVQRLRREMLASVDVETQDALRQLIELAGNFEDGVSEMIEIQPVMPLELHVGDLELSLFSVVSAFGTPQDITLDELRIESMYAADGKTLEFFQALAAS